LGGSRATAPGSLTSFSASPAARSPPHRDRELNLPSRLSSHPLQQLPNVLNHLIPSSRRVEQLRSRRLQPRSGFSWADRCACALHTPRCCNSASGPARSACLLHPSDVPRLLACSHPFAAFASGGHGREGVLCRVRRSKQIPNPRGMPLSAGSPRQCPGVGLQQSARNSPLDVSC
jgi:hypothetical protein